MSYFLKSLIIVTSLTTVLGKPVAAEQTKPLMYYGMSDFIAKLEDKSNNGALYVSYRLLLEQLENPPDFIYIPYKRTQRLLAEQVPACNFYSLKTLSREQNYSFSFPLTFLSTPRLYIRGNTPLDETLLNEKGELLSLQAFFDAHPDALMLLIDGMSYGDELDKIIAGLPAHNIVERAGGDRHNKLSGMFFRDRVDIALIYPQEVKQHLEANPQDSEPFQAYAIAGIPATTSGYVMCNRNELTHTFIAKINQALARLYDDPEYVRGQLNHSPESEHLLLKAAINEAKAQASQQ